MTFTFEKKQVCITTEVKLVSPLLKGLFTISSSRVKVCYFCFRVLEWSLQAGGTKIAQVEFSWKAAYYVRFILHTAQIALSII